jgi:hypothetical protein
MLNRGGSVSKSESRVLPFTGLSELVILMQQTATFCVRGVVALMQWHCHFFNSSRGCFRLCLLK